VELRDCNARKCIGRAWRNWANQLREAFGTLEPLVSFSSRNLPGMNESGAGWHRCRRCHIVECCEPIRRSLRPYSGY